MITGNACCHTARVDRRLTCILGLCVGHLHGRGPLGEGVEHSQPPVSQPWRGGVHHCVGTGVHHVTGHRRRHRRGDDGCWETHCGWKEGGSGRIRALIPSLRMCSCTLSSRWRWMAVKKALQPVLKFTAAWQSFPQVWSIYMEVGPGRLHLNAPSQGTF